MSQKTAESTVPTVAESGITTQEERTREDERYIAPPVDIYEDSNGVLTVVADLPGVETSNLKITVENKVLTIHARAAGWPAKGENGYVWREYQLPSFWRQFQLSDAVDPERIEAHLKNGVLTLRLPKAEAVRPREIQVKIN